MIVMDIYTYGQVICNSLLPLFYTVLFLLDYSHQFHLYQQSQNKYLIINIDILSIISNA